MREDSRQTHGLKTDGETCVSRVDATRLDTWADIAWWLVCRLVLWYVLLIGLPLHVWLGYWLLTHR